MFASNQVTAFAALVPALFIALCLSSAADDRFPDSDIQWILDRYQVSEPVSLIPAEGLAGWTRTGAREIAEQSRWSNQNGTIVYENSERTRNFQGGDIVTAREYTNFILDFAWIATMRANSGIKYRLKYFGRTGAEHANGWLGCEYQILDDFHRGEGTSEGGRMSAASLYHVFPPNENKVLNPHGVLNTGRIIVLDNHIEHWLNGAKVLQVEAGSDEWNRAILRSKFARDDGTCFGFGQNPTGFILLQDHGNTVTFETLVIREIGDSK